MKNVLVKKKLFQDMTTKIVFKLIEGTPRYHGPLFDFAILLSIHTITESTLF